MLASSTFSVYHVLMEDQFLRTKLLLGDEPVETLKNRRVAIFGVGGVGGYACEALARSGVGHLDIIDSDTVSITNINRQIIASHSTIGQYKVDVMKQRILEINPNAEIICYKAFFLPENSDTFPFSDFDYVVDAIDTLKSKVELISKAKEHDVPIISAMGAGNKIHAQMLKVSDISKTKVCPLAKVVRKELRKKGIENLKVVYSEEEPITPLKKIDDPSRRNIPGSIASVPAVCGLLIAEEIIRDLCGFK